MDVSCILKPRLGCPAPKGSGVPAPLPFQRLLFLSQSGRRIFYPASLGCTTSQSDHAMESQHGNGEASRSNGSVPGGRLRLSADGPRCTGQSGRTSRWVMQSQPLRPRLGSAASGGAGAAPVGPAGSAPMFHLGLLSTRGRRVLGRAAGAGVTETLAATRAHAPPAPWGQRSGGKSRKEPGWAPSPEVSGRKKWARRRSHVTGRALCGSGQVPGSGLNTWPLRAPLHPRDPLITDEKTQGHSAGREAVPEGP